MNLIDALCVIASSWNSRSPAEERVYNAARELVEEHAETVMLREQTRAMHMESEQLLGGLEGFILASNRIRTSGELQ